MMVYVAQESIGRHRGAGFQPASITVEFPSDSTSPGKGLPAGVGCLHSVPATHARKDRPCTTTHPAAFAFTPTKATAGKLSNATAALTARTLLYFVTKSARSSPTTNPFSST